MKKNKFPGEYASIIKDTTFVPMVQEIFKIVKGAQFLPTYCGIEYNAWTKRKMRGIDNTGKALDFTPQEKKQIIAGWRKFVKDMAGKIEK